MNSEALDQIRTLIEEHGVEDVLRLVGEVVGEKDFKKCSFCGKRREQVASMIAIGCGKPFGFLCNE